ncbi:type II 3-dehydroquinate dehydratase [Thalassospira sp. MA62]|nr:type II 3-dehydroquinate dehydratase [Thalassospira sp. MA62]
MYVAKSETPVSVRVPADTAMCDRRRSGFDRKIPHPRQEATGILGNAGAYTHISVAVLGEKTTSDLPSTMTQLSNIQKRDTFIDLSYVSRAANGTIDGVGIQTDADALIARRAVIHTPS